MQYFTITTEVILSACSKEYIKVFCIDRFTKTDLDRHLVRVVAQKLSPFDTNYKACGPIVFTKQNSSEWLELKDLPFLFSMITSNGFNINMDITKIAQKSQIDFGGDLVCIITKT